jgi:hypothetical protein
MSTPRRGKLTIVGFFSSTKLFLVNRLVWRIRYGGSRSSLCRLSVSPNSCVVLPSYLARIVASATWGMMFFSTESWKSGGLGRSSARKRNGDRAVLVSAKREAPRGGQRGNPS